MTESPSRILLPLRTSVELFADANAPAAVTTAKLAAVLYEEVIFEGGLFDVTVGEGGATEWWFPPEGVTDEQLEDSRRPVAQGAPFSLSVGEETEPGVAAKEMMTVISSTIGMGYKAQWYTDVLDDLAPFEPSWVKSIVTGQSDPPRSHPLGRLIADANSRDRRDKSLMADRPRFERSFISKAFNRDSVIASSLGASFSVSPLFDEMARQREVQRDRAGDQSLSVLIADIGALPWEAVFEFRDHPGSAEARAMLREFEQQAAEEDPADALAYLSSVARKVNRAYSQALEEQRPKLTEELAKETLKSAVSFVPAIGPLVEKTSTLTQLGLNEARQRRCWSAALMRLIRHD